MKQNKVTAQAMLDNGNQVVPIAQMNLQMANQDNDAANANFNNAATNLQISLNNHNDEHYEKQWKHFVNYEYYLQGEEHLIEREFLDRYTRLLPDMTAHMLREKSLTIWQTHLHFNLS